MLRKLFYLLLIAIPSVTFGQATEIGVTLPGNGNATINYSPGLSYQLSADLSYSGGLTGYSSVPQANWTKFLGPTEVSITNLSITNNKVTASVTGMIASSQAYWFELLIIVNHGGVSYGKQVYLIVTVNAGPPNAPPTITFNAVEKVQLDANEGTLNGAISDPDGTISSAVWTLVEFPPSGLASIAPITISGSLQSYSFNSIVTFLGQSATVPPIAGQYKYRLTVTDNSGAVTSATTIIELVAKPPASGGGWSAAGNYLYNTNNSAGTVLIGTQTPLTNTTIPPNTKLAVNGNLLARKITVNQETWADYVFDKNYKLLKLSDLEKYILANKHLPEIPSAQQILKQGLDLGNTQEALLKKIEELTLYVIELNKKMNSQEAQLKKQNAKLLIQQKKISALSKINKINRN
jgi:hypothetical protein